MIQITAMKPAMMNSALRASASTVAGLAVPMVQVERGFVVPAIAEKYPAVLAARCGPLEGAAFPPRSLGAPSSRLIARQENSAAARHERYCWLRRPRLSHQH